MNHEDFMIDNIRCYLNRQEAEEHKADIKRIVAEITDKLKDTNLMEVSFCDVSAGTIQVNLIHKDTPCYTFLHVALNHEWDNIDDLIEEAVTEFKKYDNEKHVKSYKSFLSDGEKYGWD